MLNRTGRTAEHVALFRAIETGRRRDRVIDDPYAATFLTGRYRQFDPDSRDGLRLDVQVWAEAV